MNAEQKKILKDRLYEIEKMPRYAVRDGDRDEILRAPKSVKRLFRARAKLDRKIVAYRRSVSRKFYTGWRPVTKLVEAAKKEMYFGDVRKALALVERAEVLARKAVK